MVHYKADRIIVNVGLPDPDTGRRHVILTIGRTRPTKIEIGYTMGPEALRDLLENLALAAESAWGNRMIRMTVDVTAVQRTAPAMESAAKEAKECSCESSPPGFVAADGIHCGYCGGHFLTKPCAMHGWQPQLGSDSG